MSTVSDLSTKWLRISHLSSPISHLFSLHFTSPNLTSPHLNSPLLSSTLLSAPFRSSTHALLSSVLVLCPLSAFSLRWSLSRQVSCAQPAVVHRRLRAVLPASGSLRGGGAARSQLSRQLPLPSPQSSLWNAPKHCIWFTRSPALVACVRLPVPQSSRLLSLVMAFHLVTVLSKSIWSTVHLKKAMSQLLSCKNLRSGTKPPRVLPPPFAVFASTLRR